MNCNIPIQTDKISWLRLKSKKHQIGTQFCTLVNLLHYGHESFLLCFNCFCDYFCLIITDLFFNVARTYLQDYNKIADQVLKTKL